MTMKSMCIKVSIAAIFLVIIAISLYGLQKNKTSESPAETSPDERNIQGVKWIKWYGRPYVDGQLAEGGPRYLRTKFFRMMNCKKQCQHWRQNCH